MTLAVMKQSDLARAYKLMRARGADFEREKAFLIKAFADGALCGVTSEAMAPINLIGGLVVHTKCMSLECALAAGNGGYYWFDGKRIPSEDELNNEKAPMITKTGGPYGAGTEVFAAHYTEVPAGAVWAFYPPPGYKLFVDKTGFRSFVGASS